MAYLKAAIAMTLGVLYILEGHLSIAFFFKWDDS